MDIYSSVQWVWMDLDGQLGEVSTYGDAKLISARVCLIFRSGSIEMGDGEYAPVFDMLELQYGLQGFDCDD